MKRAHRMKKRAGLVRALWASNQPATDNYLKKYRKHRNQLKALRGKK